MIFFDSFIAVAPFPKGRPRMTREGRVYTPKTTRDNEQELKRAMYRLKEFDGRLDCPIGIKVIFDIKRPASVKTRSTPCVGADLDNYLKQICDAANGVLWDDDCLVCEIRSQKRYSEIQSGIHLQVYKFDDPVWDAFNNKKTD